MCCCVGAHAWCCWYPPACETWARRHFGGGHKKCGTTPSAKCQKLIDVFLRAGFRLTLAATNTGPHSVGGDTTPISDTAMSEWDAHDDDAFSTPDHNGDAFGAGDDPFTLPPDAALFGHAATARVPNRRRRQPQAPHPAPALALAPAAPRLMARPGAGVRGAAPAMAAAPAAAAAAAGRGRGATGVWLRFGAVQAVSTRVAVCVTSPTVGLFLVGAACTPPQRQAVHPARLAASGGAGGGVGAKLCACGAAAGKHRFLASKVVAVYVKSTGQRREKLGVCRGMYHSLGSGSGARVKRMLTCYLRVVCDLCVRVPACEIWARRHFGGDHKKCNGGKVSRKCQRQLELFDTAGCVGVACRRV